VEEEILALKAAQPKGWKEALDWAESADTALTV